MNVSMAPPEPRSAPWRSAPRRPHRLGSLLALSATLASARALPRFAMACGVLIAVGMAAVAAALGQNGPGAPRHLVPWLTACATAWGPGSVLALSAAAGALRKDRTDGIFDLVVSRTLSVRRYVLARILGVALVLFGLVAGASAFVGIVALLASSDAPEVMLTMRSLVASLAFAAAYSLVIAAVTLALSGFRTRGAGVARFVAVVVGPTLLFEGPLSDMGGVFATLLPLPSALASVHRALASSGPMKAGLLLGATVVLATYFGAAWWAITRACHGERGFDDGSA
jgi:hypothetical protein